MASGTVRARWAAALFTTTYIVFWSARQIQMDLLLTLTTLAAVMAAVPVVDRDASPWRGLTLAGLAAGCGALAKGPPGLVLPLLVVVAYAVVSGRGRRLWHPALATGALAAVAVVLPWALMLASRGQADLLWEGWVRQTVLRSIAPWDHVAPWWYFLREFWIDMAPWSLFVPLALALPGRDDDERRLDRLAVVWILVVLVVFSIPASKRSPYILPLSPAVAILVAGLFARLGDGRLEAWRRKATHGVFGALGVLLVAASAVAWLRALPRYDRLGGAGVAAVLLIGLGGVVVLGCVVAARRRPAAAPVAMIAFVAALDLLAAAWVLPAINVYKSPRGFAEDINRHVAADEPVYAYRTWKWRAGYAYYAKRQIPRLTSVDELARYWRRPGPVYLVVERGMLEEARTVLGDATPLVSATIGSNEAHLFGHEEAGP